MIALADMVQSSPIKALGGAKAVGEKLRARGVLVADVTVRSWTLEGRTIPAKYWKHLSDIAADDGACISFEALAERVAAPAEQQAAA